MMDPLPKNAVSRKIIEELEDNRLEAKMFIYNFEKQHNSVLTIIQSK